MDVEGYDPEALLEEYENASGGSSVDKINALRRKHYAANKDKINAQKRAAYAKRVERQRFFGKEKDIKVNMESIYSQEYRNMFRGIAGNATVDDRICNSSRSILKHRSGTYKEDLILLDADTGKHIYTINNSEADNGISYTEEAQEVIKQAKKNGVRIVAIHNHPNSLPPTLDDGVSARVRGYDIGIVVGHDGTVYSYTPADVTVPESVCKEVHSAIAYQVETGANLEDMWYNMLKEYGMHIERR